jgi:hypothetical protein
VIASFNLIGVILNDIYSRLVAWNLSDASDQSCLFKDLTGHCGNVDFRRERTFAGYSGVAAKSQAKPFRCRPDYIGPREADCRQLGTAPRRRYD